MNIPQVMKMKKYESISNDKINWNRVETSLKIEQGVKEVDWIKPGFTKANEALNDFLK